MGGSALGSNTAERIACLGRRPVGVQTRRRRIRGHGGPALRQLAHGVWRALRFESALAVTHAGVIRVALTRNGLLDLTRWASAPIDFGAVYRIEIAAGRTRSGARLAT